MRKLSEIKGEEALDVIAEVLVPITTMAEDEEISKAFETNVASVASLIFKKYRTDIMHILSLVEGKPEEELDFNVMELMEWVADFVNEPLVRSLFQ